MKGLRRVVFWAHLVTGVVAGTVILVMCVTGAILALKPQIVKAIDRRVRTTGLSLAIRRLAAWRARRVRVPATGIVAAAPGEV